MKHYKKGGTATPATRDNDSNSGEKRTVLLRYYPPADRKFSFLNYKLLFLIFTFFKLLKTFKNIF
jgi:hypothetical protein